MSNKVVIDTNVVLDLLVFDDARTATLKRAVANKELCWLATAAMKEELVRVLHYETLAKVLKMKTIAVSDVLQQYEKLTREVSPAPPAVCLCSDSDDQKFIDLAVSYRATLYSKDKAVLKLRRKAAKLAVQIMSP